MYKAGAFYGGAGGGLLGCLQAGFDIAFNIEPREKDFTGKTFCENFGADYSRELDPRISLDSIDLLIGSPDCKMFSNLGTKRKDRGKVHENDPKEMGFYKFLEAVRIYGPQAFILENVPNVRKYFTFESPIHSKDGPPYSSGTEVFFIGESLIKLYDYYVQEIILDSADFGLAQHRKRVFYIGMHRNPGFDLNYHIHTCGMSVGAAFFGLNKNSPNHTYPKHTAKRIEGFKKLAPGQSYYGGQNNLRLSSSGLAGTVASHCSRFVHPTEPRVLTVRECARLQGFPDHFIFHGTETQQLDAVGKSISPPVAYELALYIKRTLDQIANETLNDFREYIHNNPQ